MSDQAQVRSGAASGGTAPPLRTGLVRTGLVRTGLLSVVAAALAAVVVHVVFDLAGADFLVEPPGRSRARVGAAQAAGVAALAAAVGAALTVLFARRSRRPERLVVALVVVGLLLFAPNPFVAADQGLTVAALEVMHLAVAGAFLAVVLPALARRGAAQR